MPDNETVDAATRIAEIDTEIASMLAAIKKIEDNPANQLTGQLNLYTKPARLKKAKLALAVANLTAEKRKLQGRPVDTSGYSGRQTNRR